MVKILKTKLILLNDKKLTATLYETLSNFLLQESANKSGYKINSLHTNFLCDDLAETLVAKMK